MDVPRWLLLLCMRIITDLERGRAGDRGAGGVVVGVEALCVCRVYVVGIGPSS